MENLLELVMRIAVILWEALQAYDQTPEGHAAIEALYAELEADGFDVPGWQPNPDEPPLDITNSQVALEGMDLLRQHFLKNHPDIAAREKEREGR